MYLEHNKLVNEFMQGDADQMAHGIMLVALSIQQPWHSVGTQLIDYKEKRGRSRYVWGNKKKTHAYLLRHSDALYNTVISQCSTIDRMWEFTKIPGMGLAKAGFCEQLMFGGVGCLDSHNLSRFELKPIPFSTDLQYDTKVKKIDQYMQQCEEVGGTRYLWDSWCSLIAKKYPNHFADAHHVSAVHLSYLKDSYNNVITEV